MTARVRVELPSGLCRLTGTGRMVTLDVPGPATVNGLLDALEQAYPALRGTLRDQTTQRRRPFIRFFACQRDVSHEPADFDLPPAVTAGDEPFLIVGAIAGG